MLFPCGLARMRMVSVVIFLSLAVNASVMIDDSSSSSARSRTQQPLSQSSSLLSPSSSPPPPDETVSSPKRLSDQEDERIRKRLQPAQVCPAHAEHSQPGISSPNETGRTGDSPGDAPETIITSAPPPTSPTEDHTKHLKQVVAERRKAITSLSMLTSAQRQNEALASFVSAQVAECKVRARSAQGKPSCAGPPRARIGRDHVGAHALALCRDQP